MAWQGFVRPFELLARLRREPRAWRAYLLTVALQCFATLGLAAAFLSFQIDDVLERSERTGKVTQKKLGPIKISAAGADAQDLDALDALDDADEAPRSEVLQLAALLFSALVAAQWVVLALTRDFQDRLGRDLSLTIALMPEDDAARARVRLDFKWLWRRLRRKVRGFVVLLPGFVLFVPVLIITLPLGADDWVMPPLMASWSFFWWLVFTAARSGRSWRDEDDVTPPAPIRGWLWLTQHTWGFRWWLPRWLGRVAAWTAKPVSAPARCIELAPAGFIGLSVARLLTTLPLIRFALRAPIDVAAAELIERSRPTVALTPEA